MASEESAIAATETPATCETLARDLRELGLGDGAIVLVHSSLSRLGWVAGGAQSVVEALFGVVGPTGTLVMPTQSGQLSDPATWDNPPVPADWIEAVRNGLPAYDSDLTPTRQMGQIVECFRQHRDTVRSAHPLVSFAANGPLAHEIVAGHELTPALDDASPLGTLYALDASVLLLGVGHVNNTSLHLAEHRATWPGRQQRTEVAPIMIDGARSWVRFDDLDRDEDDFDLLGRDFAATGNETEGKVGMGNARLFRQRDVVDFAVGWFETKRPESLNPHT